MIGERLGNESPFEVMCSVTNLVDLVVNVSHKGVGEGGGGGGRGGHCSFKRCLPTFKSGGGGHKWVCAPPPPPTFGQSKCSNFTICTYFVVKNTIFSKFSWLASLANFN